MTIKIRYLIIILSIFCTSKAFGQQHFLWGKNFAEKELKKALTDKKPNETVKNILLDKSTAINIAEVYLFKRYGQKQILSERPYEVYLINGYWVMMGTLHEGWEGGGFVFIMSAADGKVIQLLHYR